MHNRYGIALISVLIGALGIGGCSSGGGASFRAVVGGGGGPATSTASGPLTGGSAGGGSTSGGSFVSITAPARATVGANTTAAPVASNATPNFYTANPLPGPNTPLPLTQSTVRITAD